MFGRDPFSMFNDPFFRDPFGTMERLLGAFPAHPGFEAPLPNQRLHQHQLPAPVIEEVHDDEPAQAACGRVGEPQQPIVEEPDDDPTHRAHQRAKYSHQPSGSTRAAAPPTAQPPAAQHGVPSLFDSLLGSALAAGGQGTTTYYSTSSYTSSGPGGVSYQSSYTTRAGPGGLRETQASVRDGRSGQHHVTISRGLGDKEFTISRTRDASGVEISNTQVKGIQQHDTNRFEQEWMQHAQRNLAPMGGLPSSRLAGPPAASQHTQPRLPAPAAPARSYPVQHGGAAAAPPLQGSMPYAYRAASSAHHANGAAAYTGHGVQGSGAHTVGQAQGWAQPQQPHAPHSMYHRHA